MDNNPLQNNHDGRTFSESNNLQQSIIQPEHERSIYNAVSDFSAANDDNIFQTTHINNNYTHQPLSESTTSVSSSYIPQYYDRPQPIENTTSTLGSLNMTLLNLKSLVLISLDLKLLLYPLLLNKITIIRIILLRILRVINLLNLPNFKDKILRI
ncbi:hypothetical protein RclHR1_22830004 [Rhizophagus clarus]|uniref:Uncharacterized protein n=1 Tax=Rhizophagus clarus TaxID=94130 RepID=A0A2Z6RPQ2_9GLOM|nr:hypothetical protein RclHR1_22830004 [Rhizophagus clarus]